MAHGPLCRVAWALHVMYLGLVGRRHEHDDLLQAMDELEKTMYNGKC